MFGKRSFKGTFGNTVDNRSRSHHPDQQVRNDQSNENREQNYPDLVAFQSVTEILDLRRIAVLASQVPELDSEHKETERVNDTAGGCQQTVDSGTDLVCFSSRTDQCKGCHRRSEQRHQQHEGSDRVTGQHVILAGATK